MRIVRCYDCGKRYDFDTDDFCPRCGSFNLPQNRSGIAADGSVFRREGINERNHKGSFLHAELHEENRERKGTPLERSVMRSEKSAGKAQGEKQKQISVITAVIFAIIAFNMLSVLLNLAI